MKSQSFDKNIIDQVKGIFQKYIKDMEFKLFLFGSRVDGSYTERSDYDIGFILEKEIKPEIMELILDNIDNINTLYRIDLVDLKKVSKQFYDVSMKDAILLT